MELKHFESLYPAATREKELSAIVTYIKEGASCQLIGIPGSGRSNILGLLSYNHEVHLKHFPVHHQDVHFVMVNFSEVENKPLSEVWKLFLLSLTSSLEDRSMTKQYKRVDEIFKKSLSYKDEFVMGQGLKSAVEYLAVEEKLTIIFLFNKFEVYVPTVTKEFFTVLRSLRDRAKYRFSVIFSLSRSLDESLGQDIIHDFSDFVTGHTIYMQLFDEPSVTFRLGYLEKMTKRSLSEDDNKEILFLTGGHIRLTKLAYEAVLAQENVVVNSEFFLKQKKIDSALFDIWNELTPSEQLFFTSGKTDDVATHHLVEVDLVKEDEIQIPLLKEWIALRPTAKEDLSIDDTSHAIMLGDRSISDDLTKAEHRLLVHLLKHRDQLIERDQIIEAVWTEGKSIEGVTEQAVDQLIFRLRRKIEKDPNNPTHILTVKGRGIKLV